MLVLSAGFFVLVAWLAWRMHASTTAVAGILICVGTFLAGLVALHKMQHVPSAQGLTVAAAQRERLRQVRREIVFYRSYSPWVFAGLVIGAALLGIGTFAQKRPLGPCRPRRRAVDRRGRVNWHRAEVQSRPCSIATRSTRGAAGREHRSNDGPRRTGCGHRSRQPLPASNSVRNELSR
jgi:hypothetical protein